MLDEEEYAAIAQMYSACFAPTKAFRQKHNLPLKKCSIEQMFRPVLQLYQEMTGYEETVANAVMHHRISLYGPPCAQCGKPLRSPEASFCAACGTPATK